MNHAILIDLFMSEAKRYEPMDAETELATLKAYKKTGEQKYKDSLINHNLRFVMSTASKYRKEGVSPLEFINLGVIGLDTAIERYDLESEKKLITSAVHWIKATISGFLRDDANMIRLPANQYLKLQKAIRISKKNNSSLGYSESELFNLTQEGSSFSDPVGNDGDDSITIGDTIPNEELTPFENAQLSSIQSAIKDALDTLPYRQKEVMLELFGFGDGVSKTLTQVGQIHGITYERVRQLKEKSVKSLKENHPELKSFIGDL